MSRILGLDLGTKRIGVAISDPTGMLAQGLPTLGRDRKGRWLEHLRRLADEHQVTGIVVGLPKNMSGTEGPAAEEVRRLADILRDKLEVPVTCWDERLTTVAAEKMFQETGVKMRRAKKRLDEVAAVLILQGYLDSRGKGIED
jgi:putative Holliday junction resolvase